MARRQNDPNWRETCARRMTKTLADPGRRPATREYVKTLPKRTGPVIVSPDEFAQRRAELFASAIPYEPPPPRVDRVRPKRRAGEDKNLLVRMIEIQAGRCVHCARPMLGAEVDINDPDRASFEHVVPRARGGGNYGNRIAAHRLCNAVKSNRMPSGCEIVWLCVVNAVLGIGP